MNNVKQRIKCIVIFSYEKKRKGENKLNTCCMQSVHTKTWFSKMIIDRTLGTNVFSLQIATLDNDFNPKKLKMKIDNCFGIFMHINYIHLIILLTLFPIANYFRCSHGRHTWKVRQSQDLLKKRILEHFVISAGGIGVNPPLKGWPMLSLSLTIGISYTTNTITVGIFKHRY